MLNISERKPVLLGLAVLLTILSLGLGAAPVFADELDIFTGQVTRINGDTLTLSSYKTFEPANEHAKVPKWAKEGTNVKVGYYTQNRINYYYEIGRPGRALEIEKGSWARSQADY